MESDWEDSRTRWVDAALKGVGTKGGAAIVGPCIDHLRPHVANLLGAETSLAHLKEPTA